MKLIKRTTTTTELFEEEYEKQTNTSIGDTEAADEAAASTQKPLGDVTVTERDHEEHYEQRDGRCPPPPRARR